MWFMKEVCQNAQKWDIYKNKKIQKNVSTLLCSLLNAIQKSWVRHCCAVYS